MILYDRETKFSPKFKILVIFLLGVTLAAAQLLLSSRNKPNIVNYQYFLWKWTKIRQYLIENTLDEI